MVWVDISKVVMDKSWQVWEFQCKWMPNTAQLFWQWLWVKVHYEKLYCRVFQQEPVISLKAHFMHSEGNLLKKNWTSCSKPYLSNVHAKLWFQILEFYCVWKWSPICCRWNNVQCYVCVVLAEQPPAVELALDADLAVSVIPWTVYLKYFGV